eukprot:984473_1
MDQSCDVKTLQKDITSIQRIGGYTYGFCYGFFLLMIFIAAVCTEYREASTDTPPHDIEDETVAINPIKQKVKPLKRVKNIGKRMSRLKEIYFVIIVHMFDTLTDFLIMLEWYEKGRYELNDGCNFPNINYMGCFVFACVVILFYRLLSARYVYTYYQQSKLKACIQSFFQFLDISIFYEVYQSHLHQSTTDNLSYISKLEKTFESSPQLVLQLYVLMRELSQGFPISFVTIISILFSLISLATKVISDDKAMFFKRANQKHKIYFYSRALFRVCEISARLFAITLFATYFGANFLVVLVGLDLFTNVLLYDHGLLDTDPLNVMSYLLCVMNLGITPTTQHQLISQKFMQRHTYFAKSWHCAFIFMTRMQFIVIPCVDTNNKHYYFSHYLIRSRCIQSFIILLSITTMALVDRFSNWHFHCAICSDHDGRLDLYHDRESLNINAASLSFLIGAYVSVLLSYIQFSKFSISFMKSGMILDRNPWILFINFNFFDSIRAFKERHGPDAFKLQQTMKRLINENARLPILESHTNQNDVIELYEQLPFLIHELNEVHNVGFLYELLEFAILKLHDNFLSFFLNAYIIESIAGYDPSEYKNPKSGLNLLDTAIQRKNNLIIQIVYLNCPILVTNNKYASFFELWTEKYVTTIDIMIQNDPLLLDVKNPDTQKSIFFHCVDLQYRTMVFMLVDRLTTKQLADLYYCEFNTFMYAIQANAIWVLDSLKDKVDWNATTTKCMDFGAMFNDNSVPMYKLHPIAFAVVNDDHNTLLYLLSTDQGRELVGKQFDCFVQKMAADDTTTSTETDDSNYSLTPLMLAAMRRKPVLLKMLLKAGAPRDQRTDDSLVSKYSGKTAFDLWPKNLSKIPELIKNAEADASHNRDIIQEMRNDEAFLAGMRNVVEYGIGHSSLTDEDNRVLEEYVAKYKKSRENIAALGEKAIEFVKLDQQSNSLSKLEIPFDDTKSKQQALDDGIYKTAFQNELLQNDMNQGDYDAYNALTTQNQSGDDEKLDEEIKQDATETPTDFYVKLLIQNDSSHALKVLVQKINAEEKFDPYFLNLKNDWENSFIRLCIRYNSLKLLTDMVETIDEKKLNRIRKLESKRESPYLSATSVEICEVLLKMGFGVETKSYDSKKSLLYHHGMRQNYNILQWLLDNGCRFVNPKKLQDEKYKDNLLLHACSIGFYQSFPVLIQSNDVNSEAMFAAVQSCSITAVRVLLQNGLHEWESMVNDQGNSPLHMACFDSNSDAPGTKTHKKVRFLHHLVFNLDWNLGIEDHQGNTPLHCAASADQFRLMVLFNKLYQYPEHGAQIINKKNKSGLSAFQMAICSAIIPNIEIFLKSRKCKFDGILRYCIETFGYTSERLNLFEMLVKYGIRFDADIEKEMLENMNHEKQRYLAALEDIQAKFAEEKSNYDERAKEREKQKTAPLPPGVLPTMAPMAAPIPALMPAPLPGGAPIPMAAPIPGGAPIPMAAPLPTATPMSAPIPGSTPIPSAAPIPSGVPFPGSAPVPPPVRGTTPTAPQKLQNYKAITHALFSPPIPGSAPVLPPMPVAAPRPAVSKSKYPPGIRVITYNRPDREESYHWDRYTERVDNMKNTATNQAQAISQAISKYELFEKQQEAESEEMKAWIKEIEAIVYDTYETFSVWRRDDEEENKYDIDHDKEMDEFNADGDLITDYRNIPVEQLPSNDTNDMIQIDMELGGNKDKEILDLCLTMIDNNDSSDFAESYFNDVVMHYMFDTDSDWQILNNICAASQYEPILLKAYAHPRFKSNINAIICTHQNRKNAQLIVESLTFSYGNRYSDSKDKNKAQMDEKDAVRECIEFIMRQTIYEKLEVIKAKTLKQKLRNYIQMADTSQKKVGNVHYDSVEKKAVTVDSAPNTSSGELVA